MNFIKFAGTTRPALIPIWRTGMNIQTIKLAFSGLAATLALAAPGIGWAGDHYLGLINVINNTVNNTAGGGTCTNAIPNTALADKAIVSGGSGAVVAANPLTLSGLCRGNGSLTTADFTGNLTLQFRQVKMCKSWTAKNNTTVYDWLDQGNTRIGATGTLDGSSQGSTYRVVLTMTALAPVSTTPGTCTAANQGAYDYTVTRSAQVDRNDGTNPSPSWINLATANFTFGNTAPQGVPEPGTLSLIGLGLAGLGWVGARRARKARASTI